MQVYHLAEVYGKKILRWDGAVACVVLRISVPRCSPVGGVRPRTFQRVGGFSPKCNRAGYHLREGAQKGSDRLFLRESSPRSREHGSLPRKRKTRRNRRNLRSHKRETGRNRISYRSHSKGVSLRRKRKRRPRKQTPRRCVLYTNLQSQSPPREQLKA